MKSKKSNNTHGLGFAATNSAAAGLTGLPLKLIEEAKSSGCKAFKRNGNVDCDALKIWLQKNPEIVERAGEMVNKESEEALSAQLSRKLRERKLSQIDGELISLKIAKQNSVSAIIELKTKLLQMPARISQKLALMNDPLKIEEEILDEIKSALAEVSKKHDIIKLNCAHCRKPVAI